MTITHAQPPKVVAWATPVRSIEIVIAGAVAGLVAETVVHPFGTVSHRTKVHPNPEWSSFSAACIRIYRQEGFRGFFAGLSATLAQAPPSTALYFLMYEHARNAGLHATGGLHENLVYFAAGASAELFSSVVFVPLEVVKSRLQLGSNPSLATGGILKAETNFPSIQAALVGISTEGGGAALFRGWKAGLIQDMAFSATQFLAYETCKREFEREAARRGDLRPVNTQETLISGSLAGGLAAAVTNPFDVITSRLMVQDGRAGYGSDMSSVFRRTLQEGSFALWRGTLARVAQTAPLAAISFAVYEGIRGWFGLRDGQEEFRKSSNPFAEGEG